MKLLYYFLTKYLWSGSNTDTIFQIFFCFRKLLYYILRNNLSKADAAAILCEQSGPGLGWFGADTSPISLIFNSFMKLLNYFFMNYLFKTAAAATFGEQSGSGFWRLGADTFYIILSVFSNYYTIFYDLSVQIWRSSYIM